MASKENKFAKSEGGAMLTPNSNAQSSFELDANQNANVRPAENISNANAQKNESEQQDNEPGGTANQGEKGLENSKSNSNSGNSPTDEVQKKVLKERGKTALQTAGVPMPVAQKIVDTAEKTGVLDRINDEVNKNKKKKIIKILPALGSLLPVVFTLLLLLLIFSVPAYFVKKIEEFKDAFHDLLNPDRELNLELFKKGQGVEAFFLLALPTPYVDINPTAKYVASIMGPVYYEVSLLGEDKNEARNTVFHNGLMRIAEITFNSLSNDSSKFSAVEGSEAKRLLDYEWGTVDKYLEGTEEAKKTVEDFTLYLQNEMGYLYAGELYSFNSETYEEYLETYVQKYIIDTKLSDDSKESIIYNILGYCEAIESQLLSSSQTGSSSDEDIISLFGSIYGNESCAILTQYEPNMHEYTESQGISTKKVHSIYDAKVIYVNKNGINLYDKWDSKLQKCMCGDKICNNYEGSQVKIKFEVDGIHYIATYSNLATVDVETGDFVSKGEVVGTEGNTGCINTNKLNFQLTSENGINYNTNDLLYRCSSFVNTANTCNFNNIKINLIDCNEKTLIKQIPFYDYVKEETFNNYGIGISEAEYLKAGIIVSANNILKNANYEVGVSELNIELCNYVEPKINIADSTILDRNINAVRGQIMIYNDKVIATHYNKVCNRTIKDKNANTIYNSMCNNNALKMAQDGNTYQEILSTYYPNYRLNENYCMNYASDINQYSLNNDKNYLGELTYSEDDYLKFENELKTKIETVGMGTRAAAVEAARYLSLGLNSKIPYKISGNYFELGLNRNWADDGFDSCGFISWVLHNSNAKIENNMNILQIIKSQNITGNLKITNEFYRYYDKIQVGDFAWKEGNIGIIIGKNDGILYVAEANSKSGLIVTRISSYGESLSNYTHIYFADNYYNGTGNMTSMW